MQLQKVDPERPAETLVQGSIFSIDGLSFLYGDKTFTLKNFYPEVNLEGVRHGLVMSQSCDLELRGGRKVKVPYITVGFLEPFSRHIEREEDWYRVALPWSVMTETGTEERYTLVCTDLMESVLEDNLSSLLQNNAKNHFFVSFPEDPPETRYYTLNLTKAFPIQSRHYGELLRNVTHTLKSEFASKLGWKIAELYGRAATEDYPEKDAEEVLSQLYGIIENVVMQALPGRFPLDKKAFHEASKKQDSSPEEKRDILVALAKRMKADQEAAEAKKAKKAERDAAYRAKAQAASPPAEEGSSTASKTPVDDEDKSEDPAD